MVPGKQTLYFWVQGYRQATKRTLSLPTHSITRLYDALLALWQVEESETDKVCATMMISQGGRKSSRVRDLVHLVIHPCVKMRCADAD